MTNEVSQTRCITCQLGMDEHSEDTKRLEIVNRWLADGKTPAWIARSIKTAWDVEVPEYSVRHHLQSGHLPERYTTVQEAIEQAMGQNYLEMKLDNLAILNAMKKLGYNGVVKKIEDNEDIGIDPRLLVQVIREQQDMLKDETITYKEKIIPPEAFLELMKIIVEFVPPQRHFELRSRIDKDIVPLLEESTGGTIGEEEKVITVEPE